VGGRWDGSEFVGREATAEMYRGAAAAAYASGAAGLQLFNMFAPRGNGLDSSGKDNSHDEPFEVLAELREERTLEGKAKHYLVDTTVPRFDDPTIDVVPQLPRKTDAVLTLMVGERKRAGKRFVLRVEPRAAVTVRLNGTVLGRRAGSDVDFDVRPESVVYGANEIAISAPGPVEIRDVELTVSV
ncbi:MAG: hypothetical protein NTY38_12660, partial [Acidobacteria bacterium]|nr:hypothetical protein [Acidobacteriota bacterium]